MKSFFAISFCFVLLWSLGNCQNNEQSKLELVEIVYNSILINKLVFSLIIFMSFFKVNR
jgi:hypothetical protein